MILRSAVHVVLFAFFPVLSFALRNQSFATLLDILTLSTVSIASALFIWGIFTFFLKDARKAAFMATWTIILFFSYGYVRNALRDAMEGPFGIARHRYLVLIWGLFFLIVAYSAKHCRLGARLTRGLNIAAFTTIITALLIFGFRIMPQMGNETDDRSTPSRTPLINPGDVSTAKVRPDIYYIILDGYAGAEALQEIYGHDNSEFFNYLKQKNFYVVSRAHSNYSLTFLSLASSLNMQYLDFTNRPKEGGQSERVQFHNIKDNYVLSFLKSQGYTSIHFSSGWGATDKNRYADVNILCGRLNEFFSGFLRTTMFVIAEPYLVQEYASKTLCVLDRLAEMPAFAREPRFVFAHILEPHPPYIFGSNGEIRQPEDMALDQGWQDKNPYIDQVRFINNKIKNLIKILLSKSANPPIIIIQADHGSAATGGEWVSANIPLVRERMNILNAFYLPEIEDNEDYREEFFASGPITPVNIFRIIFNQYFDTEFELLPNKHYFSSYEEPFKLQDVTEILYAQ